MSAELVRKARALDPPPVAIEALWDGDTQGWFVTLCAVVVQEEVFHSHYLKTFSGGGDIRLFNGRVPPWPEAVAAAKSGEMLAGELGIPFHFPSPSHPEDDCPHWWQLSQCTPCKRCEILLLQADRCPWRGLCYYCHLEAEREAREAALTPEERAAPKCHICGKPALGQTGNAPRCPACRESYVDFACLVCGIQMMCHKDHVKSDMCTDCRLKAVLASLSQDQRTALQAARQAGGLQGLLAMRDAIGGGIHDAERALLLLSKDDAGDS